MAKLVLDKGWKLFKKAIDPKLVGPILEKHVGRATKANGTAVRRRVRAHIKKGVLPMNALLTTQIKGGGKPIVGTAGADLFNAITSKVVDWKTVEVGAIRMKDGYNIAHIVHEGRTIEVTDAMRGLFWVLWLAGKERIPVSELNSRALYLYLATDKAKNIFPIPKDKKFIRIPARRFLKDVIEQAETRKMADTNWSNAVLATIKEQAKKGMKV